MTHESQKSRIPRRAGLALPRHRFRQGKPCPTGWDGAQWVRSEALRTRNEPNPGPGTNPIRDPERTQSGATERTQSGTWNEPNPGPGTNSIRRDGTNPSLTRSARFDHILFPIHYLRTIVAKSARPSVPLILGPIRNEAIVRSRTMPSFLTGTKPILLTGTKPTLPNRTKPFFDPGGRSLQTVILRPGRSGHRAGGTPS
jgi:hypothetical protein